MSKTTEIYIEVSGGVVNAVYSSDPNAIVKVIDYDNIDDRTNCAVISHAISKDVEDGLLHSITIE